MNNAKAQFELLSLQVKAVKLDELEFITTFTRLGLPQEVITRLQKLFYEVTEISRVYKCEKCHLKLTDKRIEYIEALLKIEKSPKDRVGILGEIGIIGMGLTGGALSAGTLATVAGATTILGSTTLGSLLGGFLVASTPIGWTIGASALGGLIAYGLIEFIESGAENDERKRQNRNNLKKKIEELEREFKQASNIDDKYSKLSSMYIKLINIDIIDENVAKEILESIKYGTIDIDFAFENAKKMFIDSGLIPRHSAF